MAIKSNILTNAVTLSKKDILGILKNLQAAYQQQVVDRQLDIIRVLLNGHENNSNCYCILLQSVCSWTSDMAHCHDLSSVFPLKTRFINTSATILKFFVNTSLKFSVIIDGKLNLT